MASASSGTTSHTICSITFAGELGDRFVLRAARGEGGDLLIDDGASGGGRPGGRRSARGQRRHRRGGGTHGSDRRHRGHRRSHRSDRRHRRGPRRRGRRARRHSGHRHAGGHLRARRWRARAHHPGDGNVGGRQADHRTSDRWRGRSGGASRPERRRHRACPRPWDVRAPSLDEPGDRPWAHSRDEGRTHRRSAAWREGNRRWIRERGRANPGIRRGRWRRHEPCPCLTRRRRDHAGPLLIGGTPLDADLPVLVVVHSGGGWSSPNRSGRRGRGSHCVPATAQSFTDLFEKDGGVPRLHELAARARTLAPCLVVRLLAGRENEHRHGTQPGVRANGGAEVISRTPGHHPVGDNQVGLQPLSNGQRLVGGPGARQGRRRRRPRTSWRKLSGSSRCRRRSGCV